MNNAEQICFLDNQRELRARRFADQILGVLSEWLPRGKEARRLIWEELYKRAAESNLAIVSLPPDLDVAKWLHLELLKHTPVTTVLGDVK